MKIELSFSVVLATALLLIVPDGAVAADDDSLYTKQFSDCMAASGGVTVAMLDCIGTETRTQDARLNGAYQHLGSQLEPARKTLLRSAQRLWVQYRDANCGFYNDPDGGTSATVIASDCVLTATASRAKELEDVSRSLELQ